ncbi:MAG TPA: radical SAM protein [Vicinamibacterales bacterium]|nr:radical SAM protein [Vicinamibacterales bacterium]
MVDLHETARRVRSRWTHRLQSLPILALNVHTACNCRCVMCDIWMANARNREIGLDELSRHVDAIRRLRVRRVMLTGGEPLLHRNLWALCGLLRAEGIRITLVTTGLLIGRHVDDVAGSIDELVVSIDGAPEVHDAIRRVHGGFDRIAHGLGLLNNHGTRPRIVARSVVQRANHARLAETIEAVRAVGVDCLSFLAADVSSPAFNRPTPWTTDRQAEIALSRDHVMALAAAIGEAEVRCDEALQSRFIVGGLEALWRIYDYYRALADVRGFPRVTCNAPWTSAVMEPGGALRPCFFHPPYAVAAGLALDQALNAPEAVAFRRGLDVHGDRTCQRCVCTLSVAPWRDV